MISSFKIVPIILLLLFTMTSKSYSQRQKFVFLEGLGSGALVNANFDMRFRADSRDGLGFKAGIGSSGIYLDEQILTIPLGINYIIGKDRSGLLLGVNTVFAASPIDVKKKVNTIMPSLEIGYRFRPIEKGFAFQVTYNPIFNTVDGFKPLWFGVGLGYAW
ncbi:hypothetical protein ACF3OC_12925 [Sphingobacterium cellulitidis]|uniref:hypothetical protein n=1 Tax=Sphingobacterium cellulitidis TaxID=1768011 RepID=UPI00370DA2FC